MEISVSDDRATVLFIRISDTRHGVYTMVVEDNVRFTILNDILMGTHCDRGSHSRYYNIRKKIMHAKYTYKYMIPSTLWIPHGIVMKN